MILIVDLGCGWEIFQRKNLEVKICGLNFLLVVILSFLEKLIGEKMINKLLFIYFYYFEFWLKMKVIIKLFKLKIEELF